MDQNTKLTKESMPVEDVSLYSEQALTLLLGKYFVHHVHFQGLLTASQ